MDLSILKVINEFGPGAVAIAIVFSGFITMLLYVGNDKSAKQKQQQLETTYKEKEYVRQKEHSNLCQDLMRDNRQALDNNTEAIKLLAQETKIRNEQFQQYNDKLEDHDKRAQRMEIDINELKVKMER